MGAFTFAVGFLISLFFVVLVVIVGRKLLGWGDDALVVWIGTMYWAIMPDLTKALWRA